MRQGARTLRGVLTGNEIRQLVVDDGIFTNGLRITYFTVWQEDFAAVASAYGLLSTRDTVVPPGMMPANDPAAFAWAAQVITAGLDTITTWHEIDPDHVVNEELFIHNRANTVMNYLIVAEPYQMTEDEGVLQLVKNKQQDV